MASIISIGESKKLTEARAALAAAALAYAAAEAEERKRKIPRCLARITGDKSNAKSFIYKQCTNPANQQSDLCLLCLQTKNEHLEGWRLGATTKKELQHLGPARPDQYPAYLGNRGHGWHGIVGGSIPYFARSNGADAAKAIKESKNYNIGDSRKFGYE